MDNKLLEYPVEELLVAALRKGMIMRLTSVGSPIDQELIDNIVIEMSKNLDGFFARFSEALTEGIAKYWTQRDGGTINE